MRRWRTGSRIVRVILWGCSEHAFDEARKRHIPPGYHVEVQRIQLRRIARDERKRPVPVMFSEVGADCSLDFPGVTVNCRGPDRSHRVWNCVIVDYKSGKMANVDKLVQSETSLRVRCTRWRCGRRSN